MFAPFYHIAILFLFEWYFVVSQWLDDSQIGKCGEKCDDIESWSAALCQDNACMNDWSCAYKCADNTYTNQSDGSCHWLPFLILPEWQQQCHETCGDGEWKDLDEWVELEGNKQNWDGPSRWQCRQNWSSSDYGFDLYIQKGYPDPGMIEEGYDTCLWHCLDPIKTGEYCDIIKSCHPRCDSTGCTDDSLQVEACKGCIEHSHLDENNLCVWDDNYGPSESDQPFSDCQTYIGECHVSCKSCSGPNDYECISCQEDSSFFTRSDDLKTYCKCNTGWIGTDCQIPAVRYYVASEQSGKNLGTAENPYIDLMLALTALSQGESIEEGYEFLLLPDAQEKFKFKLKLDQTSTQSPFEDIKESVQEIRIATLYWDEESSTPNCTSDRSQRAIIDYRNPNISFKINTSVKIVIENVILTSAELLYDSWTEHWWMSCHEDITLTTDEKGQFLSPHGSIISDYNLARLGCYWEDQVLIDKNWYLFSVENIEAKLEMSNVKFENWRFRQRSVINIYTGEVLLNNVDFENTIAAMDSMPYNEIFVNDIGTELGLSDNYYKVPGIITATKIDTECNDSHYWIIGNIPAAWGKFAWNGGSVTGHNIDMNPYNVDKYTYERFWPFLNLSRLSEVQISGLDVYLNFMIDTKEFTPSLFTVQFWNKVSMQNISFDQNWLSSGAIALFISKEYLPFTEYAWCSINGFCEDWEYGQNVSPFDLTLYEIKNLRFKGNKSGLNPSFSSLIAIKSSSSWVSVLIEDVSVENHDFNVNSYFLRLNCAIFDEPQTGYWYHEYLNLYFNITSPININLNSITVSNTYGGSIISGENLPNLYISNWRFTNNKDFGLNGYAWEFQDWSHMFTAWKFSHYDLLSKYSVGCYNAIELKNVQLMEFEEVQIAFNTCSYGTFILAMGITNKMRFSNVMIDTNIFSYTNGASVTLNPLTTDPKNMPEFYDWQFIGNINSADLGSGAIALYEQSLYANYPLALNVTNWLFDDNNASKSGAIIWEGTNLIIENSVFSKNHVEFSATVVFSQYVQHWISQSSSVIIRNCTFTENESQSSYSDLVIQGNRSRLQLYLEIVDTTFSQTYSNDGAAVLSIESVSLLDSVIQNTQFFDSSITQLSLFYKYGSIKIKDCTFRNINTNHISFMYIRGISKEVETIQVNIEDSTFTGNIGSYGIKWDDSALAFLKTENCEISYNDLQFLQASNVHYTDISSQVIHNYASQYVTHAPYFDVLQYSIVILTNTIVANNNAQEYAGAIRTTDNSELYIYDCEFNDNSAGDMLEEIGGQGVIASIDKSIFDIKRSVFQRNQGPGNSVLLQTSTSADRTSYIDDCQFLYNEGNHVLRIISNILQITNSLFDGNFIEDDSPGIYVTQSSELHMENNIFRNTECEEACYLYTDSFSEIYDINSIFRDANGLKDAVAYINSSIVSFNGTQFLNNTSDYNANLYIITGSYVLMNNVTFDGSYSNSCILTSISSLDIRDSLFTNFDNTAIVVFAGGPAGFNIQGSYFISGGSQTSQGGALSILDSTNVTISNVTFEDLSASIGGAIFSDGSATNVYISQSRFVRCKAETAAGAIYVSENALYLSTSEFSHNSVVQTAKQLEYIKSLSYENKLKSASLDIDKTKQVGGAVYIKQKGELSYIENWTYYNNTARLGGAIFIDGNIQIASTTFYANQALYFGGGLFIQCSEFNCEAIDIKESNFTENSAENFAGGGLFIQHGEPNLIDLQFMNNTATIGPELSSNGVRIQKIQDRILTNEIQAIPSGQLNNLTLYYEIVDGIGQRVIYDNETAGYITSQSTLDSNAQTTAINGILSFRDFMVTDQPNNNITLNFEISMSSIGSTESLRFSTDSLQLYLQPWINGEIQTPSGACYKCDKHEYSFEAGAAKCHDCPDEAVCHGGINVYPKKNYWRAAWDSEEFYFCRIYDVCLGGEDTQNFQGECEEGYSGRIWTVCEENWARVGKYRCTACLDDDVPYYVIIWLFICVIFAFSLYVLRGNIQDVNDNSNTYAGVLLRIMTNHIQLIAIVQSLRLEWPEFVQQYYNNQEKAGSSSEIALNLDCIIDRNSIQPVYANLIGVSMLPVILIVITIFIWTIIKAFRRKMSWINYQHYIKGTITNMMFLLHPTILKSSMQMFACSNIEGKKYLDVYMEDECWTGDHWMYSTTVALPAFILWGIGFPFMAFLILAKLNGQKKLEKHENQEVLGFLYLGYLRDKYWWELIILARKVIILAALIWLNAISVVIQALVALSMLFVAIYLQASNKPFNGSIINRIEEISLIVGMITVYAGLWYLTGDVGEETSIILFILMLTVNAIFGIVWITAYLGNAEWAEIWVKGFRAEKSYINTTAQIPYIPIREDEAYENSYDKSQFLISLITGCQIYTNEISANQIGYLMQNRENFMVNLFNDLLVQSEKELTEPENSLTTSQEGLDVTNQNVIKNDLDFSFKEEDFDTDQSLVRNNLNTVLEDDDFDVIDEYTDHYSNQYSPPAFKKGKNRDLKK